MKHTPFALGSAATGLLIMGLFLSSCSALLSHRSVRNATSASAPPDAAPRTLERIHEGVSFSAGGWAAGNSSVFFNGYNGSGFHIFASRNGVVSQISDTSQGDSDDVASLTWADGKLYFWAQDTLLHHHVCVYDGSAVTQISSTAGVNGNDAPSLKSQMIYSAGKLYFWGADASGFYHVYVYNGSNVTQISNTAGGVDTDYPFSRAGEMLLQGTTLYFIAADASQNLKLYKYDGTSLTQVSDTNGTGYDDDVHDLTYFNGGIFFGARSSGGTSLFAYDGTSVSQISNISGGNNDDPEFLTVVGNSLYFTARDFMLAKHLYTYNGSSVTLVGGGSDPSDLLPAGNLLYFTAWGGGAFRSTFVWDGSSETQISSGTDDDPESFTLIGTSLAFIGINELTNERHVFYYDGTLRQISNTSAGGDDYPSYLIAVGGVLYFGANDSSALSHLYSFDGSSVTQISNLGPSGENVLGIFGVGADVFSILAPNGVDALYKY